MAEILDIVSEAIELAEVCMKFTVIIYSYFRRERTVDETLNLLVTDINLLGLVLKSVCASSRAGEPSRTALEVQHWENIRKAMEDCKQTLDILKEMLKNAKIEREQSWRLRLVLIYRESTAQNGRTLEATMNRVESSITARVLNMEAKIDSLVHYLENDDTMHNEPPPDDIDLDFTTANVRFMEQVRTSVRSAQSVVHDLRSSHTITESPPSSPIFEPRASHDLLEAELRGITDCPASETQTIPASLIEDLANLGAGVDLDLMIIQRGRERAKQWLEDRHYSEAKERLESVLKRSERRYGNVYEWKDETMKLLGLTLCKMHRWNETEEIIQKEFEGRDQVLCALLREYCDRDMDDEAQNILARYRRFEGRDKAVDAIVENHCITRRWEAAARFASEVEFFGQERPLEIVAEGCQHEGRWIQAANLWKKVLDCKLKRAAPTAETLHSLANANLHLRNLTEAKSWCDDAIEKRFESVGSEHVLFMHSMNLLAFIHVADGNPQEAQELRELMGEFTSGTTPMNLYPN